MTKQELGGGFSLCRRTGCWGENGSPGHMWGPAEGQARQPGAHYPASHSNSDRDCYYITVAARPLRLSSSLRMQSISIHSPL